MLGTFDWNYKIVPLKGSRNSLPLQAYKEKATMSRHPSHQHFHSFWKENTKNQHSKCNGRIYCNKDSKFDSKKICTVFVNKIRWVMPLTCLWNAWRDDEEMSATWSRVGWIGKLLGERDVVQVLQETELDSPPPRRRIAVLSHDLKKTHTNKKKYLPGLPVIINYFQFSN